MTTASLAAQYRLFLLALVAVITLATTIPTRAAERPNVIFILADDLGWSDTTLYGTTKFYQTPNLERLAKRGVTFTRAYSASPLCSPTRSAILTGLSPARTGITTPNCHLPQDEGDADHDVVPAGPCVSRLLLWHPAPPRP